MGKRAGGGGFTSGLEDAGYRGQGKEVATKKSYDGRDVKESRPERDNGFPFRRENRKNREN